MTDLNNKVSKLEVITADLKQQSDGFSDDIHDIKNDVHDIKKDVEDGKRVTDMNTQEIKETNKILTNSNLLHAETNAMFKGGFRVIKIVGKSLLWLIATGLTITGMYIGLT